MENWEAEKVYGDTIQSVAALSVSYPRCVGIEGKTTKSFATAFVICLKPVLFLTNKHVLNCAGLAQIEACFVKRPLKDKVMLRVKYIDPVHDFAVCSLDTKPSEHSLFNALYPLKALSLANDIPIKGTAIMAIGASRGKTIERKLGKVLDIEVNPPNGMDYNVWQVETDDKSPRGFSGGPVVDRSGRVVAMVASSYEERTFHFPASIIKKVVKMIIGSGAIMRGSLDAAIETSFSSFDEDGDELDKPRRVFKVTKSMNSDLKLMVGDEILKVRKHVPKSLNALEDMLDAHVGKDITYQVLRKKKKITLKRKVTDLSNYNIDTLLEFSNSLLHTPEYNILLFYNIPMEYSGALFVSQQGYLFEHFHIPEHCLITQIGQINLLDVKAHKKSEARTHPCMLFLSALKACLKKGTRLINITFELLAKRRKYRRSIVLQPKWFPTVIYKLDKSNRWRREVISLALNQDQRRRLKSQIHQSVSQQALVPAGETAGGEETAENSGIELTKEVLFQFLVHVRFIQPFNLDGNQGADNFIKQSTGLLVDSQRGLIVCERFLINSALGDCIVTFDGRKSVVGKVVMVHPTQLFSVIKVSTVELAIAKIILPDLALEDLVTNEPLDVGDVVTFYGMTLKQSKILEVGVQITTKEPVNRHNHIRYSPKNIEYFTTTLTTNGLGGFFFSEEHKKVIGLHVHFMSLKHFCGIVGYAFKDSVSDLVNTKLQKIDLLPVALSFPNFGDTIVSHMLDENTEELYLNQLGDIHRTVMSVDFIFPLIKESKSREPERLTDLEEGDLIQTLNNTLVTNMRQVQYNLNDSHNAITVVDQNGVVQQRDMKQLVVSAVEVDEVFLISGVVFHKPSLHLLSCATSHRGNECGAILSQVLPGSPCNINIPPGKVLFITEVNRQRILNWDHFVVAVKEVFSKINSDENDEDIKTITFEASGADLDEGDEIEVDVSKRTLMFYPPRQIRRDLKSLSWHGKELFAIKVKQKNKVTRRKSTSKAKKALFKLKQKSSNFKSKVKQKVGKSKDTASI